MNNKELKAETEAQQSKTAELLPSAPLAANPLLYAGIFVGQKVHDSNGIVGNVVECSEEHNVLVEFDEGGQGFYCLHDGCPKEDCLYACI